MTNKGVKISYLLDDCSSTLRSFNKNTYLSNFYWAYLLLFPCSSSDKTRNE